MITKSVIDLFCKRNGLENSVVCLHSSFKSFGEEENGPNTIIDGFLDNQVTLLCPTFYYDGEIYPDEYNYKNNGVDYSVHRVRKKLNFYDNNNQIDKSMGLLPKTVLKYTNSIRTHNPLSSFVALGYYAEKLMESQSLLNVYSCYKNIAKNNLKSYILLAGVDLTKCTPVHYCEELAGRKLFRRWAFYHDKKVEVEDGSCSEGFEQLRDKIFEIEKVDNLGSSEIRIYEFNSFINLVSKLISKHPDITHCKDEKCLRCNAMKIGGRSEEKVF